MNEAPIVEPATGGQSTPPPIALANTRQRFHARTGAIAEHNNMVGSAPFMRGREAALLAYQEELLSPTTANPEVNLETAQANAFRLQGAARIIEIFTKLGWQAPPTETFINPDSLPIAKRSKA